MNEMKIKDNAILMYIIDNYDLIIILFVLYVNDMGQETNLKYFVLSFL